MSEHTFCRITLHDAMDAARDVGLRFTGLSAIRSTSRLFWVEFLTCSQLGAKAAYVKADCATSAKAKFINDLLQEREDQQEGSL